MLCTVQRALLTSSLHGRRSSRWAWLGTVASGGVGKVAAEICGEVLTSSKFCWCEEWASWYGVSVVWYMIAPHNSTDWWCCHNMRFWNLVDVQRWKKFGYTCLTQFVWERENNHLRKQLEWVVVHRIDDKFNEHMKDIRRLWAPVHPTPPRLIRLGQFGIRYCTFKHLLYHSVSQSPYLVALRQWLLFDNHMWKKLV